MTGHPSDLPEFAVVPFFLGLPFDRAFDAARAAGVVLAQPDPDGPPLRELVWGLQVRVVTQDPPAGTVLRHNHSVVVTWTDEEPGGVREPRRQPPPTRRSSADNHDRRD